MFPSIGQDTQQCTPAPEAERRDPDNYENSERSIQHDDAVERREVMKKFEIVIRGANEEAVAHDEYLLTMQKKGSCLWLDLEKSELALN